MKAIGEVPHTIESSKVVLYTTYLMKDRKKNNNLIDDRV